MKPDLSVPARSLEVSEPLFRIHLAKNSPAWFSNSGEGRFDPAPDDLSRFGTCYLGWTAMSAFVEVFGAFPLIPRTELRRRRVSTLRVRRTLNLANLSDRRSLGRLRADASLSTGDSRIASRQLASDLWSEGFDGIFYRVRHDPQMELEAVALFSEPGQSTDYFDKPKTMEIPDILADEAGKFGIDVVEDDEPEPE